MWTKTVNRILTTNPDMEIINSASHSLLPIISLHLYSGNIISANSANINVENKYINIKRLSHLFLIVSMIYGKHVNINKNSTIGMKRIGLLNIDINIS